MKRPTKVKVITEDQTTYYKPEARGVLLWRVGKWCAASQFYPGPMCMEEGQSFHGAMGSQKGKGVGQEVENNGFLVFL